MNDWLKRVIRTFETNPNWQYKFHLAAMMFWIVNFIVGTIVVLRYPAMWLSIGVYYVFALSIYANWTSDYTAVSATLAAMHAERILEELAAREGVVLATDSSPSDTTFHIVAEQAPE
jgi:hypothetical protein